MRAIALIILSAFLLTDSRAIAETSHSGPFKGYGKYREPFRQLCLALREDGRANDIYFLLKPYSERDTDCVACRPFFLSFIGPCRGKEIKEKEKIYATPTPEPDTEEDSTPEPTLEAVENKVEPTVSAPVEEISGGTKNEEAVASPAPTPPTKRTPERDPSALVIDRASRLFYEIAQNEEINLQTIAAINKLVFILSDKNLSKQAALDYFATLSIYIQAPFEGIEKQAQKKGAGEDTQGDSAHEAAPANADSLFDE